MSLHARLRLRAARGNPVRVGLIGAGKFGAMYAAQLPRTPGVHLIGVADRAPSRALDHLARASGRRASFEAPSLEHAAADGRTHVSDDWQALLSHPALDVVIEATGDPIAAVEHALFAFRERRHVIMATVEADAYVGPVLARRASEAGVVYSLAYGDQPALICELVDWARSCGFSVVAAGRGHKWRPEFARSTPDTVWDHYGLTREQAALGGLNPKMFNSFLDGSKPAIECAAVCNASDLTPAPGGLTYPPASIDELPELMRPREEGGILHHAGQIEVVSSLAADGRPLPYDIRFGVWIVFEGESEYIQRCFAEYGVKTDSSGRYACSYKRWHLIGLEVGLSVASVALRTEATGCASAFRADAIAVAKRNLQTGEILDGEGGYTVVGQLASASESLEKKCLPLGLAQGARLRLPARAGEALTYAHVELDESLAAVRLRRELEQSGTPS